MLKKNGYLKNLPVFSEPAPHVLEVDGLDWNHRENGVANKTSEYELVQERKAMVARRGNKINISVNCK